MAWDDTQTASDEITFTEWNNMVSKIKFATTQTKSANYTLAASDYNSIIQVDTGGVTITLPDGLSDGFQAVIVNTSSGTVTLSASTTLNTKGGSTSLANQYGAATVVHTGSNVWLGFGDLS